MPRIKKTKNQVIVVPTQKTIKKVSQSRHKKIKPAQTLTKSRSVRSKENTLAYFNCLVHQVADPLNERVKITQMCHQCKHNKGKVAWAKQEEKQLLVKEVAQNYLDFGKSLGSLLHADITCSCQKK